MAENGLKNTDRFEPDDTLLANQRFALSESQHAVNSPTNNRPLRYEI